jgi:hypothetical protein
MKDILIIISLLVIVILQCKIFSILEDINKKLRKRK